MALVVQQVNRAGAVISTQKFPGHRIVLGRALDCDVILQDPHIEPHHLVIEQDPVTDRLSATDLSSLNGSWRIEQNRRGVLGHKKTKLTANSPFFSGQVFELGRSHVRICSESHTVAPAIPLSRWEALGHRLSHWWVYGTLVILLIALQVWDSYLSNPERKKLSQFLLSALYPVLGAVVFAGIWAFIGKNIRHDTKFSTHLSTALAALLAVAVFEFIAPYWVYHFGVWNWQGGSVTLFTAATVFALGYMTLSFATHLVGLMRVGVAAVVPMVLLIPMLLEILGQPEFNSSPPYDRSMVEPAMQFRKATDVAEFIEASEKLYKQVSDQSDQSIGE